MANPVPDTFEPVLTGDPYFDSCIRAPNCETYLNPQGEMRIRFKAGMEPGSADHKARFAKRDGSSLKSKIRVGDKKLLWGCGIDPTVELPHIEFACKDGSCDSTDPFIRNVQYVDVSDKDSGQLLTATQPDDLRLQILSRGSFSDSQRRPLIDAIVNVAKTPDMIHWIRNVRWTAWRPGNQNHGNDNPGSPSGGVCAFGQFSSFVGVTIYDAGDDGGVHSFMWVEVSYPDKDKEQKGFCGQITKVLGAVSGFVGGAAGSASGIFGLIEASCG